MVPGYTIPQIYLKTMLRDSCHYVALVLWKGPASLLRRNPSLIFETFITASLVDLTLKGNLAAALKAGFWVGTLRVFSAKRPTKISWWLLLRENKVEMSFVQTHGDSGTLAPHSAAPTWYFP